MSSLYGVDSPLLHVTYLEDLVMVDGELVVRTAFLFSTAVTSEPVSVSVMYTRPGEDRNLRGCVGSDEWVTFDADGSCLRRRRRVGPLVALDSDAGGIVTLSTVD